MGSGLKNPCLSVLQHNLVIIRRNAVYNIICSILLRYDVEFKLFDLLIRMVFLKVLHGGCQNFLCGNISAIILEVYSCAWLCCFSGCRLLYRAFLATAFTSSAASFTAALTSSFTAAVSEIASFTAFFACADTALVLFLVAILSYLPVVCIRPLSHTTGLSPAQTFLCKSSDAIRKL